MIKRPFCRGLAKTILFAGIFLVLSGCGAQQFKTDVFQDFYSVGWGPSAMTWSGKDLIIGEETMVMELTSIDTGSFVGETFPYNSNGFFSFSRQPQSIRSVGKISGLAWEGDCCGIGYLWVADSKYRQIVKLSPSHEVLRVFAAQGYTPQGLAFDGKDIWTADAFSSKIYKLSSESGQILSEITSPIERPLALAFDCGNLLILGLNTCKKASSDCIEKRLVKMNVLEGRFIEEISLPRQIQRPISLASAKDILWIGDRTLNRVFKISNSGSSLEDTKTYASAVTPTQDKKPRKIEIVEKPQVMDKKEDPDEAKKAADEAKKAADEAKKSADEAKKSADEAKKAFELQQKK